jgi:tektin-2
MNSTKLRETMFVPQNKTLNDLLAQNDKVNYSLRRRIYDTERIKNELEWQKWNVRQLIYYKIIYLPNFKII